MIKEIHARLGFLLDVGLDYLSLERPSGTLSGGEAQRIRLATQIGAGLVGVLYVLDEPSIGLHQRDNRRLIETLTRLRDLGNTLIVVEHDEDTIRTADWVVDIGPGAGEHGGQVVVSGTVRDLLESPDSLTGAYLSRRRVIPTPALRRPRTKGRDLTVVGAREHNLRTIDVSFPLGLFVAVTGVSGSGKSTLVNDILYTSLAQKLHGARTVPGRHKTIKGLEHVDKVVHVDQSPIGRTPRSNPATYTGVFDHMRKLFAETTEAKVRGYLPGRFSFNVKGGRCEACSGDGTIKIEMNFLPDVYVPCEVCHGARYNRETLEVHFKGKTIAEVLDMPIEEASEFFKAVPAISRHLSTLVDVGLGYVRLGQPAPTLSGGEAQRVKLASELQKRSTGRTVYVLDEPTTGLHFEDISKLLVVLQGLADKGNTVIVIEHNLDVIKTADWVVDMGPEGGSGGGMIVAEGTPEQVAAVPASHTGVFLKDVLQDVELPAAKTARKTAPRPAPRKPAPGRPPRRPGPPRRPAAGPAGPADQGWLTWPDGAAGGGGMTARRSRRQGPVGTARGNDPNRVVGRRCGGRAPWEPVGGPRHRPQPACQQPGPATRSLRTGSRLVHPRPRWPGSTGSRPTTGAIALSSVLRQAPRRCGRLYDDHALFVTERTGSPACQRTRRPAAGPAAPTRCACSSWTTTTCSPTACGWRCPPSRTSPSSARRPPWPRPGRWWSRRRRTWSCSTTACRTGSGWTRSPSSRRCDRTRRSWC